METRQQDNEIYSHCEICGLIANFEMAKCPNCKDKTKECDICGCLFLGKGETCKNCDNNYGINAYNHL